MIEAADRLRYLLAHDAFAICPLLPAREFVSFCNDRGLNTSEEHLERMEKLGLLYPIARVKWPRVTRKIETVDGGRRYLDHGILKAGETWAGETREEWGRWQLDPPEVLELLDEGHMWDPKTMSFQPWSSYRDLDETHTETFYSMFQCVPLEWKLMWLTVRCDTSIFADGADAVNVAEQLAKSGVERTEILKENAREDEIAFVTQALATRYYPLTRTDRRTFTLNNRRFRWNWYRFASEWDAKAAATDLGISSESLAEKQEWLSMIAESRDPLAPWYQLVRFIAVSKKEKLKGTAQFAQLLYAMEYMFRLFAKDAFTLDLHPPDEGPTWKIAEYYGEGVPDHPHRHLEFVVNEYHLNPRPKLILVVEGRGEEAAIPRIAEQALRHSLPALAIEVRSLGGIGEYTGKKKYDERGALEKFIDDYHYRQTYVFIILDREGRAEEVTKLLAAARSKLYPSRMLTCPDYIHLWKRNIEFDNFTHDEIAAALTAQARDTCTFSADEIAQAEQAFDRGAGNVLSRVYEEKVGHRLNKVECLRTLTDMLIRSVADIPRADRKNARPILELLGDVIHLAALNHQPTSADTWKDNQESGYFGKVIR